MGQCLTNFSKTCPGLTLKGHWTNEELFTGPQTNFSKTCPSLTVKGHWTNEELFTGPLTNISSRVVVSNC